MSRSYFKSSAREGAQAQTTPAGLSGPGRCVVTQTATAIAGNLTCGFVVRARGACGLGEVRGRS